MNGGVGIVTTVAGRHGHLLNQRRSLMRSSRRPDVHVVVAMGDQRVRTLIKDELPTLTCEVSVEDGLPLSAARNLGAATAIRSGVSRLIFLDVDCLASRTLVERYSDASTTTEPTVWCGEVHYLPPRPAAYPLDDESLNNLAHPHPARPGLSPRQILNCDDYALFWSVSFAIDVDVWRSIGGFNEVYRGYGAEDTDFAQTLRQEGVAMHWLGGARAYHQHHRVSDPPIEHLHDIIRNANIFQRRWGWWPMGGWLESFAALGEAYYDSIEDEWHAASPDTRGESARW